MRTRKEIATEPVRRQRPDLNLCAEGRSFSAKIEETCRLCKLKGPLVSQSVNHKAVCQAAKDVDRMWWWDVVAVPFCNRLDCHRGGHELC